MALLGLSRRFTSQNLWQNCKCSLRTVSLCGELWGIVEKIGLILEEILRDFEVY